MTCHDDWLIHVAIGRRVYSFNTEMWPEHGFDHDWSAAAARAERQARQLDDIDAPTWHVQLVPMNERHLESMLDNVCRRTSDRDFRRFIR
jgi:hypothetical protein